MKRFRFSLRPVVTLRAHYEARAREAFAASVRVHTLSEEKLACAHARVVSLEAAVVAGRQHRFSAAGEAQNLNAYRAELGLEATAEQGRVEALRALDQRRSEYVAAHHRLEVLHRLEERAVAAHRHEVQREEQAEFDDMSGRRAARKTPSHA